MENRKRALGRGLEQLFNSENLDFENFEKQIIEGELVVNCVHKDILIVLRIGIK